MDILEFHSQRLTMRPWSISDAEPLYRLAKSPIVGPSAGWKPHQSVDESLDIIRTVFSSSNMWAVTDKATGNLLGCIGFLMGNESNISIEEGEAEVGYWIGESFWDRGYATESLQAVIKLAFQKQKIRKLCGCCFTDNARSMNVMRKCGFKEESGEVFCPNLKVGYDRPVKTFSLLKQDWKKSHFPLINQLKKEKAR